MSKYDHTLESLLELHGEIIVISKEYWTKFEAKRVDESINRPQGIKYSLTLHNSQGKRVIGFDNSHEHDIRGKKKGGAWDHKHHIRHGNTVKEYIYETAGKLLADFWQEVDEFLGGM